MAHRKHSLIPSNSRRYVSASAVAAILVSGATVGAGPTASAARVVLPGPPTVTSTAAGDQTATVRWQRPARTGSSPIVGYRVFRGGIDLAGTEGWSTRVPASTRFFKFRKLANGTNYPLAVRAITAAGRGPRTWVTVRPEASIEASAWLSGASGDGVNNGQLGAWRGQPMEIAGTWNDNWESHEGQWSLQEPFDYSKSKWTGNIDNAVGAIYKNRGESWSAAANGAYDARWARVLKNVDAYWGDRPGTMYLRFAHEFNGNWFPWSVTAAEAEDFKTSWRRFRALQLKHAPDAKLVFCPSYETSANLNLDWRKTYPGAAHVDVMAVDYYNQWPFVKTRQEFDASIKANDQFGAPKGLEQHRLFAQAVGEPFAISEWSSNASMGDSPAFVNGFYDWMEVHAGKRAGEVLYEIHFNVSQYGDGIFQFWPATNQPGAAKAYQQRW